MATPQFAPQFASSQTTLIPIRTTAPGKQAVAGDVGKAGGASVQAPVQKDASSAFNQLVAQFVAESADPASAPTPAVAAPAATAQTVKLPPVSTGTSAAISPDPSTELPVPLRRTAPAPLPETSTPAAAPAGGRRADTRSAATSNADNAQPPALPVDVNIPIPIAPKLQLPSFAGGGSAEQKPVKTAAVSSVEEPAAITLEPKPILEVKIHLNQPVNETSFVQTQTAPAVPSAVVSTVVSKPVVSTPTPVVSTPAPVVSTPAAVVSTPAPVVSTPAATFAIHGAQEATAGQGNPERGSSDPGDADPGRATEVSGRASPRAASVVPEAAAILQQQRPDAGSTQPLAHDSAATPVGAVPAPPLPTPAPATARVATPEPAAGSASPAEEPQIDRTKTQQPLRSLALEFSPDGAGDIKVRLSERAGDVHISLHGTDPSLAGRVREGVGDLVGSLTKAGYETETWTPGQGRQQQRQQPDQRQPARGPASSGEEFSGILQQPIQEIS